MQMKIGIDISCLAAAKTGVGLYTYHLIQALLAADMVNRYYLFSAQPVELPDSVKTAVSMVSDSHPKITTPIWEQVLLPRLLTKAKIDVFHTPNYVAPIVSSIPVIITVHDLSVFLFPDLHPFYRRWRHQLLFPTSVSRAAKIIAVSNQTKQDLATLFPTTADKTVTIYNGLPVWFYKDRKQDAVNSMQLPPTADCQLPTGFPEQYILFVGTLEPRKNLELMLQSFATVKHRNHIPHKLVVIGGEGWGKNRLQAQLAKYDIETEVVFTGHLEYNQLPSIYHRASLLVFPSLYEGFGFPPLEAMACGIPVIASNISSIPEVVGDAGILLNPDNWQVWADTIYTVLTNKSLQLELRQKGINRAHQFSWEKTAQQTLTVYEQATRKKN
jgi:glycosyltransferase involved in cell wall biosynthesis